MKSHAETLETLKRKLSRHPGLAFEVCDRPPGSPSWELEVPPAAPDGFAVTFWAGKDCFIVRFDAWVEEFTSEAEALRCFAFGLSEKCRLKVLSRGEFDYAWTVEYRDGGEWREYSTTGLVFSPFWRKKQVRYLRNHHFPDADSW
jgi:hypothetical protein